MDLLNSESLQGIAISNCSFIPKGMVCFRRPKHCTIFICVWNSKSVVIYGLEDQKSKSSFIDLTSVDKEELTFMNPVVNVFIAREFLFAADVSGVIYELSFKKCQAPEDEYKQLDEVFEMSPESPQAWTQMIVGVIHQCYKLLAISALNSKIIAVTICSGKLLAHVYSINSFHRMFVITLTNSTVDKVMMCNVDLPLSNDLREQYFSFLDPCDPEISVIGLNSGEALSFSLSKPSDEAHIAFSSAQPIANIEYLSDERKQRCIAILVFISSGSLIMLNGKSSRTFLNGNYIQYSLFNRNKSVLITSDGINTDITNVQLENCLKDSSLKCSLKGMRAACCVPGIPNLILVSTQHCCIYWLDLCEIKSDDSCKFVMPEDQVVKDIYITAKSLNEAHVKMKKEDSILKAVSLANRAKFLENYFTILVKFFSGKSVTEDKLKLRIENDCDFVKFTEDLWSLNITISYGNSSAISFVHKLDKSFSKDLPLMVEFLCSPVIESELSCQMIARVDESQPLLIIPLGKVVIDAGYFLSIVKDKTKLLKLMTEPSTKMGTSETVDYYNSDDAQVKSVSSISENNGFKFDKRFFVYSMKIDTLIPVRKCLQTIFCDSSHRMSKNQWLEISDTDSLEVSALIGQKFWVELSLDKEKLVLLMKSNDIYACYLMKRAVSSRLGCRNPVEVDSDVYVEAEGIKYRYELARLNMDWNLKEFQDIKNEFRSHIVNKLSMLKK